VRKLRKEQDGLDLRFGLNLPYQCDTGGFGTGVELDGDRLGVAVFSGFQPNRERQASVDDRFAVPQELTHSCGVSGHEGTFGPAKDKGARYRANLTGLLRW